MQPETRAHFDELRKVLHAAMVLADGFSKPASAAAFANAKTHVEALVVEVERLTAATDEPHFSRHPLHYCMVCGSRKAPGPGCGNCRQTGYDQTPCLQCQTPPPVAGKSNPGDGDAVDVEDIRMEAVSNALDVLFPGLDADGYDLAEITSVGVSKVNELRDLLREAWEYPEYPGPEEGCVSTEDDYPEQAKWREGWDELDDRVQAALVGDTSAAGDERRHPERDRCTYWFCGVQCDEQIVVAGRCAIHARVEADPASPLEGHETGPAISEVAP